MSLKQVVSSVVGIVSIVVIAFGCFGAFENNSAKEFMVVQSPFSGELTVYTDPGLKWQGWGTVTKYPRQKQYTFCSNTVNGVEAICPDASSSAKRLRFNDGGHADLNGSVSWYMPTDAKAIIQIHKTFGSEEAVENAAVSKMLDAAVYLAGPLMSSTESSGERRAELVHFIDDQAENGVYVTHVVEKEVPDIETEGKKKTVTLTEIVLDSKGQPMRQQGSILSQFSIKLQPMSISEIKYDEIVEKQIKQRQEATTAVQISQANAKKATQDAITTAKVGEANAAKAKWDQETLNAKDIASAEKALKVATLGAQTAEQNKRAAILEGEGEARKRELIMSADGALDKKLDALVKINTAYADAIKHSAPGAWTPTVVMGHNGGNTNSAQSLMDMFSAKTAKDLGVDLQAAGASATSKRK